MAFKRTNSKLAAQQPKHNISELTAAQQPQRNIPKLAAAQQKSKNLIMQKLKINPNENLLSELTDLEKELGNLQKLLLKNDDDENVKEVKNLEDLKKGSGLRRYLIDFIDNYCFDLDKLIILQEFDFFNEMKEEAESLSKIIPSYYTKKKPTSKSIFKDKDTCLTLGEFFKNLALSAKKYIEKWFKKSDIKFLQNFIIELEEPSKKLAEISGTVKSLYNSETDLKKKYYSKKITEESLIKKVTEYRKTYNEFRLDYSNFFIKLFCKVHRIKEIIEHCLNYTMDTRFLSLPDNLTYNKTANPEIKPVEEPIWIELRYYNECLDHLKEIKNLMFDNNDYSKWFSHSMFKSQKMGLNVVIKSIETLLKNLKDETVLDILQEIVGIDKDIRLDPPMENIREERRKYGR